MAVQILIADDDAAIRRLLRRVIEEHEGWQVCGEAENGREALTQIGEACPDLVVLDLAMPQMNGLQAARVPAVLVTHDADEAEELGDVIIGYGEGRVTGTRAVDRPARPLPTAGFHGAVSKSTGSEVVRGIETLLRKQDFFSAQSNEISAYGA